jgi:RHS repeat-associated protein
VVTTGTNPGIYSYSYDGNGNRLTKIGPALEGPEEDYTSKSADLLKKVMVNGVLAKSYTYDYAGRTTSINKGGDVTGFSYDLESRITGITYHVGNPLASTVNYLYNAFDTRVQAGTTNYLRSGPDVTDPLLSDGTATYTPGISQSRNGTSTFDLQDRLGSATYQTNTAGIVTGTRTYDPYGVQKTNLGAQGPFGFAGGYGYQEDEDADTGLKVLGHRYFDSSTGRFLTRDQAHFGRNWYAYCSNRSNNLVDPTGLSEEELVLHYLYVLVDDAGKVYKMGVTKHHEARYRKWFLDKFTLRLQPVCASTDRILILGQERMMIGRDPGPWNRKRFAGKIKDVPLI